MRKAYLRFILPVLLLGPAALASSEEKRRITLDDMQAFKSVSAPVLSPNGKRIAFTIRAYCPEEKETRSDIHLMDINGTNLRRLTAHPGTESGITWSPDGDRIAFSAVREGGKSQVYIIDIHGGEAVRLTGIEGGARNPSWSPDGKWIAFYSSLGRLYIEALEEELGDVRYITHLRYYHYRSWDDGRRQRIFVVPADGSGEPVQLTRGECSDEGDTSMAWAPDGREIAFVANRDEQWWNTIDTNIYTVTVPGGEMKRITGNPGPDHSPAYSPDGSKIAWRSIFTYNYESENYKVVVAGRGGEDPITLTGGLDRSVRSFRWAPDGKRIHFLFGTHGVHHVRSVSVKGGAFEEVMTGRHVISGFEVAPDGKTFVVRMGDDTHQPELHTFDGRFTRLTRLNDEIMDRFIVQPVEEIWFKSPDGSDVQGWVIKPVGFEEGQKYPLILSIHGGPHGMSTIGFRDYFQVLAARGYAVLYTNPRASLGYGERFSREIWEDWGGRCYEDLMAGVDRVVKMGFVDERWMGVTGGSFGGYMTNWIVGQTDRFAAAVTVAGLSNLVSFFGTTDEQFFPECEFKGAPWINKEVYLKHSPIWYAKNFKTPTMIIHGQYDYRVRTEQAEQMFTALQKTGVPSVYVWFPDEGHGVRKPDHRKLYYKVILDWFDHHLKGQPSRYLEMAASKDGGKDQKKEDRPASEDEGRSFLPE